MSDHRTALARTRGLGAAKEGLRHWWGQRVTALLLIPLVIWFVIGLVVHTGADHAAVTYWLSDPVTYGLMLVLLGAVFWHAALGIQAVIDDYIGGEWARLGLVLLAKLACLGLFVAAYVALTFIAFAG
jgi:succinate dehydrogenase / fumarate reductase, membrane anchor subunit